MPAKAGAARALPIKGPTPLEYLNDNFESLVDYVLIIPIEKPISAEIVESDHYKEKPTWGIVAAVGSGRVVNGVLIAIDAEVGDEVMFTKYGEEVELDGYKAQLVHATEVKIRRKKKVAQ